MLGLEHFVPTVFVSYQTRNHRQYLPEITQTLRDSGLQFWSDQDKKVPALRHEGLEWALLGGLEASDALLLLQRSARKLAVMEIIFDFLETISLALSLQGYGSYTPPFAVYYWLQVKIYEFFYGIDILRIQNENWQSWEARVGQAIGLDVIRVTIVDKQASSDTTRDGSIVLDARNLRAGLLKEVVPPLAAARPRRKPEMRPEAKEFLDLIRSVGIQVVRIAVIGAVLLALTALALLVAGIAFFGIRFAIGIVVAVTCFAVFRLWRRSKA